VALTTNHGRAYLYRHDGGNRNGWLAVQTRGVKSNRDGVGAKIRMESAGGRQWRARSNRQRAGAAVRDD